MSVKPTTGAQLAMHAIAMRLCRRLRSGGRVERLPSTSGRLGRPRVRTVAAMYDTEQSLLSGEQTMRVRRHLLSAIDFEYDC